MSINLDKKSLARTLSYLLIKPKLTEKEILDLNYNDFKQLVNKFSEAYDLWFYLK